VKSRLDRWLVERGLAETREKAQAQIMAGEVLVNGQKALKAGQIVSADARVEVTAKLRYVGRGGLKLEGALTHFGIGVEGFVCADFGSSTGGFTDCLLQAGAVRVHAIDVGAGQLDWKLVSFISATLILPAMIRVLKPADGIIVVLVKPQFEVGKGQVGKGGIVRDAAQREAVCEKLLAAVGELGFKTEIMESPITGAEGNREFLLYGHR